MVYSFFKAFATFLLKTCYGFKTFGKENMLPHGRAILVANHACWSDIAFLWQFLDNREFEVMAKDDLFRIPVVSWLIKKMHVFPVKRFGFDRESYNHAAEVLKAEKILVIFPEGRRSHDKEMKKFQPGAVRFALQYDAPVLPVGTFNSTKFLSSLPFVHKSGASLGEPIYLKRDTQGLITQEEIDKANNLVFSRVKELIESTKSKLFNGA